MTLITRINNFNHPQLVQQSFPFLLLDILRKQREARILITCKGGGAARPGGSKKAISAPVQKTSRQSKSTNQVDKSTWSKPPGNPVLFYEGKRVKGSVGANGSVSWTLDGNYENRGNKPIPSAEIKDMKRAWKEYIKSPNANQKFTALAYNMDGKEDIREKSFQKFGFKIDTKGKNGFSTSLYFDNRK